MILILFGEAVNARPGVGPLALATNEIASNGCGAFMAGYTVAFHIGNDVTRINAMFE